MWYSPEINECDYLPDALTIFGEFYFIFIIIDAYIFWFYSSWYYEYEYEYEYDPLIYSNTIEILFYSFFFF